MGKRERYQEQVLSLQHSESLTNGHRRDTMPPGHPHRPLRCLRLEKEKNPVPTGAGALGVRARDDTQPSPEFRKYMLDKQKIKGVLSKFTRDMLQYQASRRAGGAEGRGG